ncbi:MAG: hypothetical protein JXA21_08750 [Anaerolineae bacterium]|nr:hypothetical protein [Anaerolineae bacterium]
MHATNKALRPSRQRIYWGGLLILLIGSLLRIAAFDEALIEGDQSAILTAAIHTAHFRYFPLVGMKSSVGVMQAGIIPLLAALPLMIVNRAIAVRWFFAALDLLALAWLYRSTGKTCGRRAAFIVGMLYAANPWIIEYVRTIWYQTLIPTFATVSFAAFLNVLGARKAPPAWQLTLALVGATLMGMVHLVALPWALLLFGLGLVLAWKHKMWREFWIGVALSALIVSPYVIYLFQSGFGDLRAILRTGSHGQVWHTSAYRMARELFSGANPCANAHGKLWDNSVLYWKSADKVVTAMLLLAAAWLVVSIFSRRGSHAYRPYHYVGGFALVWLVLVPALFLRSDTHLQDFYLLGIFPAPFVLIGLWIEDCFSVARGHRWRNLARAVGLLAAGWLLLIVAWWISIWVVRIRLEAQGLLERHTRAWLIDTTGAVIQQYLEEQPQRQFIILPEFSGDVSAFDWLRAYVNSDAVRIAPAGAGMIIPADETCYLLGPDVPADVLAPVADRVTLRSDMAIPANPPWDVYCMPPREALPMPLATWSNGLELLESTVAGDFVASGTLSITYRWHYRVVDPRAYHFFNHLFQGETFVTQIDGPGVPTPYWRDDDVLITHFVLPLPETLAPGDYRLLVGAYTWPEIQPVLLTDGQGSHTVERWTVAGE